MQDASQTSGWASGDIAETIAHLEQQWAAATKTNEVDKVAVLLLEIFIEMEADGTIHRKSDILDRVKADKWEIYEVSGIKVIVTGNIAIASGTWHGKGTLANGKVETGHERWLDTWHKNGKWQCVASASAPMQG